MAYVVERKKDDGTTRYLAQLPRPRGPDPLRRHPLHPAAPPNAPATARSSRSWPAPGATARLGAIPFRDYVENDWLPSKHIEPTTRAAYVSNLNKHFYPFFGKKLMYQITASLVQDWVTQAAADGLSPRSIRKYHTMLHSIFKRAVRDQLIVANPCEHTELPKVIARKSRTLTPTEYDAAHRRDPRPAPAAGRDRDRDRHAVGRAHRAAPPPHRLPPQDGDRRGDHHRGLQAALPHRRALRRQALPQGQRTPHLRRRRRLARRRRPPHQHPQHRPRPAALHHQQPAPRSPATPSAPASGSPPSKPAASTSPSACTTSATPTPPGSSPKDPTSSPSWNAWATPRSKPPRNTSTPSPKPTRRTSTPSHAHAADDNNPTDSRHRTRSCTRLGRPQPPNETAASFRPV